MHNAPLNHAQRLWNCLGASSRERTGLLALTVRNDATPRVWCHVALLLWIRCRWTGLSVLPAPGFDMSPQTGVGGAILQWNVSHRLLDGSL